MVRLTLYLLGPFEVRLDGEPITGFHSDKVRALLAYLATEAGRHPEGRLRPHRRETLVGLLWPDYPERSARTSLSNALSHLRTALGDREATPPFLLGDRETAQLNPEGDCWVDVSDFTALTRLGDPSALEEAMGLYRGSFLEGFSLADSPPFEHWALAMREQYQAQALQALSRLATYHEGRGEYEQAIGCARRQIALAPWQEDAHRTLMRTLALSGQRGAALAQYEVCRRALEQELGVAPAPETTRLYECIRDGEIGEAGRKEETPHNLPAQLTPFIGREDLLAQIGARLSDPACRLLTLVGPGGNGKTRLALEAAADRLPAYADGVFFVSLAPLQTVEGIVPAVAQAIGFSPHGGQEPKQQVLHYLRRKRLLLVLDNYEHLLAGAGLASEILGVARDVKILATSRTGLNVRGEHRFSVEGMDYPDQTSDVWQTSEVLDASRYSAVKLFLESARRAQPDFGLTADNVADVARICQLVEGMPLAILLAAAWAKPLTPAEIADEIGRSIDFLEADVRDVPERHKSACALSLTIRGICSASGSEGYLPGCPCFAAASRGRRRSRSRGLRCAI